MKKITILLLAATITAAGTAVADELEDMMKKNGCNACHSEDKKVIGPSSVIASLVNVRLRSRLAAIRQQL